MLDDSHENLEGLRRLFAGQISPVEAERIAAHLTGCRECWLLATRAMAAHRSSGGIAVLGPLRSIIDLHEVEQAGLREWLEAQATWPQIRDLSTKARREKVRLTRSLHTPGFLKVLLEEGASATLAESEEFFYLALLVGTQLPFPRFSVDLRNDLCAECCAELANARRRLAKWPAARDALKKGFEYAERGSKNGVTEAKVLCVAGAVEDDLDNTMEAARIIRRAADLFEATAQTFLYSRTLAQLAYILVDVDPAESLRAIDQALPLIPTNNNRLALLAEGIKIDCLIALGSPQEALLRFKKLKKLNEQFREPFIQLRVRFTAARLLELFGQPQRAEILLQEVIAGDLEHGLVRNLFLDLVYLLGFHLRRGQTAEAIAVCRRASQELSLLDDDEGIGESAREQMTMVWRRLEEEVKRGTVDLGATTVLKTYIKAHWRTPAIDPPSFQS
jgi:tetratricopeptide (TPR) repeat protein